MSLRLEMLQVARLARLCLRDSTGRCIDFLQRLLHQEGGFTNRAGECDLYYTVFGMESLHALQAALPADRLRSYLCSFGDGESLDFVHLACLARCWAALPGPAALDAAERRRLLQRLNTFRSRDGGFQEAVDRSSGSAYGCFLALGAWQDLGEALPDPEGIANCLLSLRSRDGAFANHPGLDKGNTPATVAALTVLRYLGKPVPRQACQWLQERFAGGGFFAAPGAPMPDLLSTATALHCLSGLQISLDNLREPCLDFLDTLWSSRGSFYGSWADTELDTEYTFYGLLALGHLS